MPGKLRARVTDRQDNARPFPRGSPASIHAGARPEPGLEPRRGHLVAPPGRDPMGAGNPPSEVHDQRQREQAIEAVQPSQDVLTGRRTGARLERHRDQRRPVVVEELERRLP